MTTFRPEIRHVMWLLAFALLTPSAARAQGAPKWAEDLLKTWYERHNAADAAGVAALYTQDAVFTKLKGRAALEKDLAAQFAKDKVTCSGGFDAFQEIAGSAVGWGRDTCTLTPRAGGTSRTLRSRWLLVYERQADGSWLTVRDVSEEMKP
jgi:uncharacterized protein (TIGR02246 family)